jgi:hypothetical protein
MMAWTCAWVCATFSPAAPCAAGSELLRTRSSREDSTSNAERSRGGPANAPPTTTPAPWAEGRGRLGCSLAGACWWEPLCFTSRCFWS